MTGTVTCTNKIDHFPLCAVQIYGNRDLDSNRTKIIQLFDDFRIEGLRGMHVAMVFEALGPNLLKLIKRSNYQGIPLYLVKHIMRQVSYGNFLRMWTVTLNIKQFYQHLLHLLVWTNCQFPFVTPGSKSIYLFLTHLVILF